MTIKRVVFVRFYCIYGCMHVYICVCIYMYICIYTIHKHAYMSICTCIRNIYVYIYNAYVHMSVDFIYVCVYLKQFYNTQHTKCFPHFSSLQNPGIGEFPRFLTLVCVLCLWFLKLYSFKCFKLWLLSSESNKAQQL